MPNLAENSAADSVKRPLVIGHRGASHQAPENTIEAFTLAHRLGADGIELDVHRSADGVLVVHHDAVLDGVGLVMDRTFAELRAALPSVPALAETFDALVVDGVPVMAMINVEIKCCSWDVDADPDRIVARGVAEMVAERGLFEWVVVSSFDLAILDDIRAIDARLTTGWLIHGHNPVPALTIAHEHGHAWLHPDWGNLDLKLHETMAVARELNVRINTWTLDDPTTIREFAAAGVDAIITNEPDIARSALVA